MPAKDPRVDGYIKKAAPFAQPILNHVRAIVHKAWPDVDETIKWSVPAFYYKGPLCGMASYEAFSPSHKREYVEWVTEAKTDDTRDRRMAQAIAWMAEGKPRNWKYM